MTTLITGATRGVGLGLAQAYAARGDTVIGTARATPPEVAGVEWLSLDASSPDSVGAMAASFGNRPLARLICNAGVYLDKGARLTGGYTPEIWANSFAVNVTGVFLCIEALLPQLRAAKGKIAILSSQMASDTRAPGGSYAYRASKAAVLNLGRNLATDLVREGIAVGIYHPGWVRTDMGGGAADISVDEAAAGLVARIDALSLASTGCFETWDGRAHPY